MVLIGWEFNVGRETVAGLMTLRDTSVASPQLIFAFTVAVVAICLLYTLMGGLRSNVTANTVQNIMKGVIYLLLIFLLFNLARQTSWDKIVLLPSPDKALAALGVAGLITNVVFSLAWQYVDMSTWHSVIASKKSLSDEESASALKQGGFWVFLAPGVIGTLLGALLTAQADVNANNILSQIVSRFSSDIMLFLAFVAIFASIMSMVDGLLLAAAYALVCDLLSRDRSLESIDENIERSNFLLGWIRVFLTVVAVAGIAGVYWLLAALSLSLFDIVYVLIIAQLSLFGAVWTGLTQADSRSRQMHYSIVSGLLAGAAAVFLSKMNLGPAWLL